jgi:hypothetical protein
VLAQLPTLTLVLWGSATLLTVLLLVQLLLSGQQRIYPLFLTYLGANLVQTVVGVVLYQGYGFGSREAYYGAWTTQAIVAIARAFVAAEVCYLILGKYEGVWGLAARVLTVGGLGALCLALYFGRTSYRIGAMTLEVGLETCISTGIAGLFLFARYYQIPVARHAGILGAGLGLLSCSRIVNDVVFERFLNISGSLWNHLSAAAFVAILLVWIWALRSPATEVTVEPALRPVPVYREMIPAVNRRLAVLNEQLNHLWRSGQSRS